MASDHSVPCVGYHPRFRFRDRVAVSGIRTWFFRLVRCARPALAVFLLLLLTSFTVFLRIQLEGREAELPSVQHLRFLPRGEILKPALLGYSQVGADILWLQVVQVVGSDRVQTLDYEWMRHAVDVITTLDPEFTQAYDLGGVMLAELAHRVDWSNALLEKGMAANPHAWRLPFLLGFNYFFHLQDYSRAAGYMAQAARLSGSPSYVSELTARLYAQADSPEVALEFLYTMRRQATDPVVAGALDRRRGEVLIERDVTRIEAAIADHRWQYGSLPSSLEELVQRGLMSAVPIEPFGGSYRLDVRTGQVVSSTHPRRLRVFRPDGTQQVASRTSLP